MQPRRSANNFKQRPPARNSTGDDSNGLTGVRKHRPDYWLLILMVAMLGIGLVVVYAISPALGKSSGTSGSFYVTKQLIAVGLSLVAFAVTSRIPIQTWKRLTKPLIIIACIATLLAVIMPINPDYPARRWVRLGGFSFQSVELVKFALMIWLAGFFAWAMKANAMNDTKKLFKPLIIALGVIGGIL